MNPFRPFILRLVATSLPMLAIVLVGIVACQQLPPAALSNVDDSTIEVVTLYPGTDAETMTSAVTAPLEHQLGQITGLQRMSSMTSGGRSVITLRFAPAQSLASAGLAVQAAIDASGQALPADLPAAPTYRTVESRRP